MTGSQDLQRLTQADDRLRWLDGCRIRTMRGIGPAPLAALKFDKVPDIEDRRTGVWNRGRSRYVTVSTPL
jgi:hypothetical protein